MGGPACPYGNLPASFTECKCGRGFHLERHCLGILPNNEDSGRNPKGEGTGRCYACGEEGHIAKQFRASRGGRTYSPRGGYRSRSFDRDDRTVVSCDYCRKMGHVEASCWKKYEDDRYKTHDRYGSYADKRGLTHSPQRTTGRHCGFCRRKGHMEDSCFDKYPELKRRRFENERGGGGQNRQRSIEGPRGRLHEGHYSTESKNE